MAKTGTKDTNKARTWIALTIVGAGIVGIVAISAVALTSAAAKDRAEMARLIFSSVLPLIGTWVGAVLAFYFSRDNLQAAAETTLTAIRAGQGLTDETRVAKVMIRVDQIRPQQSVADVTAAQALELKGLFDGMKSAGMSRVPIFSADKKALFVVHEPDIDKYAQVKGVTAAALATVDTMQALCAQSPDLNTAVTSFGTVLPTATIADARTALRSVVGAKDLFVTENGKADGTVVGWITNSDLARMD
ncbi:hypothetical protein ACPPVS_05345 [Cellulomonas sp. McL0617]|uniref:hypothetical protein n=1 Tax=Cellulomonas sp. McL0617 TaxID=3415675 RepID=UPI003CF6BBCF